MKKLSSVAAGCLLALIAIAVVNLLSWVVVCGIVYFVTFLFDWTFTLGIVTLVWLALLIIAGAIGYYNAVKD